MPKRVAIYVRVSTEEQSIKGVSIEAQKDALMEYIKKEGYIFNEKKHTFIDAGKSGASADRPELERLMLSAKRREFDLVLVWKIDRFFRKTLYLLEYVEYLIDFEVGFKSITQDFTTDTSSGKMILGIFGVIAELERDMIRERTSMGKKKKAEQGFYVGGAVSFGYKSEKVAGGVKLSVDEYESKVVKRIFELFVKEKKTLNEIRRILDLEGLKNKKTLEKEKKGIKNTSNSTWATSSISKILNREKYIGKYYYGKTYRKYDPITKKTKVLNSPEGQYITLKCERILDDDSIFWKAQELLVKNRQTKNNEKSHIFAGLIKCNYCGRPYVGYNTHSKKKQNYRCRTKMSGVKLQGRTKCINHEVREDYLIDTCWKYIYEIFKSPDKAIKEYYESKNKNSNLDRYIKDRAKLEIKEKNHLEGLKKVNKDIYLSTNQEEILMKQEIVEELNKEKLLISNTISELDFKINSIKNKMEHLNNLNQLKAYYDKRIETVSIEKKIEIIKELVEIIHIYEDGTIKIVFKFQRDDEDDDNWMKGLKEERNFNSNEIDFDYDDTLDSVKSSTPSTLLPLNKTKKLKSNFDLSFLIFPKIIKNIFMKFG